MKKMIVFIFLLAAYSSLFADDQSKANNKGKYKHNASRYSYTPVAVTIVEDDSKTKASEAAKKAMYPRISTSINIPELIFRKNRIESPASMIVIPIEPTRISFLRPERSIKTMATSVKSKLVPPMAMVCNKARLFDCPTLANILGA